VTVGGAVLVNSMGPGGCQRPEGREREQREPPPAASSTPSAAPSTSDGSGAVKQIKEVPKDFIGTWQGQVTQDNGLSGGLLTAVISKGKKGVDVIHTSTTLGSLQCNGLGRLVSGTEGELRISERTDPDRPTSALCTSGTASVAYTLTADGALRYQSQEAAAGNPYGTLRKSG
jgi:hypothetical protein